MEFRPTPEQVAIIDSSKSGESLAVNAVAGAGKTSTLKLLADANSHRTGRYVAFNKAIVVEAERKFPANVACSTIHSAASRGTDRRYMHRLGGHRIQSKDIARKMGLQGFKAQTSNGAKWISEAFLGAMVMKTVRRFCSTGEPSIEPWMMPYPETMSDVGEDIMKELYDQFRGVVTEAAQKAWDNDLSQVQGELPYEHSFYLKSWELEGPDLHCDFLLVDEAQDLSGVMLSIVEHNRQQGAQIIAVGDQQQQIYGWNGAINALDKLQFDNRLDLTGSFRFGADIADAANFVTSKLASQTLVRGLGPEGTVGPIDDPRMFLARTNAATFRQFFNEVDKGRRPHIVGGGGDVISFAKAAQDLMDGRPCTHPDLSWAGDWGDVLIYVNQDELGGDLKLFVDLVQDYGTARIISAMARQPKAEAADVVLSTAHKAKGLEHRRVRLLGDFPVESPSAEELRLLYVAITRAQVALDIESVAYMTKFTEAAK